MVIYKQLCVHRPFPVGLYPNISSEVLVELLKIRYLYLEDYLGKDLRVIRIPTFLRPVIHELEVGKVVIPVVELNNYLLSILDVSKVLPQAVELYSELFSTFNFLRVIELEGVMGRYFKLSPEYGVGGNLLALLKYLTMLSSIDKELIIERFKPPVELVCSEFVRELNVEKVGYVFYKDWSDGVLDPFIVEYSDVRDTGLIVDANHTPPHYGGNCPLSNLGSYGINYGCYVGWLDGYVFYYRYGKLKTTINLPAGSYKLIIQVLLWGSDGWDGWDVGRFRARLFNQDVITREMRRCTLIYGDLESDVLEWGGGSTDLELIFEVTSVGGLWLDIRGAIVGRVMIVKV